MTAQYLVRFNDGFSEYVHSADAKSFKKADVRVAYVKARKKAETRHKRAFPDRKFAAVEVRCVG